VCSGKAPAEIADQAAVPDVPKITVKCIGQHEPLGFTDKCTVLKKNVQIYPTRRLGN